KERIDNLYSNIETRPYAVLFTYDLFINNPSILDKKYSEEEIINELEFYSYNNEVALFLFYYYADRLNFYNHRMKYHNLLKNNSSLESKDSLNVLFFNYIAEYYSHRYKDAYDILKDLKIYYPNSIRKDKVFWLEQDSNDIRIFEGKIITK